ncbi:MAG: formylglycine-generating enzyme family protein [Symploca sp. SIO2E6]|nr:formylglycine-generating enzyme family protein [Symploca sp. SIO2E6]
MDKDKVGPTKLKFCHRLGDDWRDLAIFFDIRSSTRNRWDKGTESQELWELLERQGRLHKLPAALLEIGREDLFDMTKGLSNSAKDSCEETNRYSNPPKQPPPTPQLILTRRRLIELAGFGCVGLVGAVIANQVWKLNRSFKFDVVTVDSQGRETNHKRSQAEFFVEGLSNGVTLEMVAIPSGKFMMGSPTSEKEREGKESPLHEVTVQPFFMGKYPVTQAQWKAVAALPKVNRDLKAEPFRFKGDNLPVEQVFWYDAVEFCARLSKKTERIYRLPSEAEWEYACRAGTTTPFHFGETITSKLANYGGMKTYNSGPKGEYRGQTTPVGNFQVANAFGLYDMHGNVWEWCADSWHNNYQGAPTDGSAWNNDNDDRLLRGGSWFSHPARCRSAFRILYDPGVFHDGTFGFRVVCEEA